MSNSTYFLSKGLIFIRLHLTVCKSGQYIFYVTKRYTSNSNAIKLLS